MGINNTLLNAAYHMFVIGLSTAVLLGNYFSQEQIDRRDIAREKKRLKGNVKKYKYVK